MFFLAAARPGRARRRAGPAANTAVLVTQDRCAGPVRGRRAGSGGQEGHRGQRERRGRQRGSLSSAVSAPGRGGSSKSRKLWNYMQIFVTRGQENLR